MTRHVFTVRLIEYPRCTHTLQGWLASVLPALPHDHCGAFRGEVSSLLDAYFGYFGKCAQNVVGRRVDVVTRLGLMVFGIRQTGFSIA